jgi:hypothetical protein
MMRGGSKSHPSTAVIRESKFSSSPLAWLRPNNFHELDPRALKTMLIVTASNYLERSARPCKKNILWLNPLFSLLYLENSRGFIPINFRSHIRILSIPGFPFPDEAFK